MHGAAVSFVQGSVVHSLVTLCTQKMGKGGGVIVNEDSNKRPRLVEGTPSRVLCLRNMVGPGEVDEELEDEVGTELTKYGNVTEVLIFEVTTAGYPPEEAVRIFVQFDIVDSATRALMDLNGRFFGGRQIRVAYFDEGRFGRQELAPLAGEFPAEPSTF